MYVVVAENHSKYEEWLEKNFVYVGDPDALAKIDPEKVKKIVFVADFRKHPLYFTDAFLKFQMDVALQKQGLRVKSVEQREVVRIHPWYRLLKWLGFRRLAWS